MRSNKMVRLWVISVAILLFMGCSGNSDDSVVVKTYFEVLSMDNNVEDIREMTDPFQRSPRIDYHLQDIAEAFAFEKADLEKLTYSVVARSDTTVRYRVSLQTDDFFIELAKRDDKWYVASIPGPVSHHEWPHYSDSQRPMSKKYPRYTEIFGTGSSFQEKKMSAVEEAARRERERRAAELQGH